MIGHIYFSLTSSQKTSNRGTMSRNIEVESGVVQLGQTELGRQNPFFVVFRPANTLQYIDSPNLPEFRRAAATRRLCEGERGWAKCIVNPPRPNGR
jgi:hypothetical protein